MAKYTPEEKLTSSTLLGYMEQIIKHIMIKEQIVSIT